MSADNMPPLPEPSAFDLYSQGQLHAYARAYAAEQTRELVEALSREIQRDIMNLNCAYDANFAVGCGEVMSYKYGHQNARHAAVEAVLALIAKHKGQA